MKTKTILFFLSLLLFSTHHTFSQSHEIDSLKKLLSKKIAIEKKIEVYNELGRNYKNFSTDSAILFAKNALTLLNKYYDKQNAFFIKESALAYFNIE